MSYAQRWDSRSQEQRGGGSVRAARQRLAAGDVQQRQQPVAYEPPSQATAPLVSQYSPLRSPPQYRMPGFGDEADSPIRQAWPLGAQDPQEPPKPLTDARYQPPPMMMPAPIAGNSRRNQPTSNPSNTVQDQWQDENYLSPYYNLASQSLSNSSQSSSLGSIPDFPAPQSRRIPSLGPPPVARRGPSSYYSQFSYVSPIREESEHRSSVKSYASSNVIPTNVPEFYLEETPSDDEGPKDGVFSASEKPTGLLRQASLGKRGKPNITTIKSPQVGKPSVTSQPRLELSRDEVPSRLGRDEAVLESSSASSAETLVKGYARGYDSQDSTRPLRDRAAPDEIGRILGSLEKGGAIAPGFGQKQGIRSSLADRVGARRPPRLNVDAVKSAEARGSLTSLPDLIKRATKLAANLDRGKTASRLGTDWMFRDDNNRREKPRGSVNSLLNTFPIPDRGRGNMTPRTEWPSNPSQQRMLPSQDSRTPRRESAKNRGCCGLSCRAFTAVMIILFLLVAAAVIIPVVLIIVPRNGAASNDKLAAAKSLCAKSNPCENGGSVTIMPDGSCGCLCTNGFTGLSCANPSDLGCTTISTAGVKKATVGSQIPRLLDAASTNYSIPLQDSVLLAQFSRLNMTCAAENALVSFPGLSKRSAFSSKRMRSPMIHKRDATATGGTPTNSIAIATVTTSTGSPAAVTMMSMPSGSVSMSGTNATSQDFAKVGILFVLQDSQSVDVAVVAQEKLGSYLTSAVKDGSTPTMARNITLGNGYSINLYEWTVTLRNGTIYGNGWNGTVTAAPLVPTE
jgi:hypothetical protein